MKEEILRMENITLKEKGEFYLDNLNFHVLKGEIMGLIVSDAKGSKQLIDLICHNRAIDFGRVYYMGQMVNHYSHTELSDNRVYVIEERSRLIENLSVADNLFVIRKGFKKYIINNRVLNGQVTRLMEEMGVDISPDRRILSLTSFERCIVELLKAKMMGCSLVILDHVSDFLSQVQLKEFQQIVREACNRGVSFLYVANHHQEVFRIADRAALFAKGMILKVFEQDEMKEDALLPYSISFDMSGEQTRDLQEEAILQFDEVVLKGSAPLSFYLHGGECLMILDNDNCMWEDLVQVFSGERGWEKGTIILQGNAYKGEEPVDFLKQRLAVIPDNPIETFLFRDMNYMENLTFLLDRKVRFHLLKKSYLNNVRKEYFPLVGTSIDEQQIDNLDAKQKYGLAYFRIHLLHPRVAVCVQPLAKGDMYCRRYVLDLIQMFKNSGIAVLIVTSNIADNMDVSDRMLVLQSGKNTIEYSKGEFYRVGW